MTLKYIEKRISERAILEVKALSRWQLNKQQMAVEM